MMREVEWQLLEYDGVRVVGGLQPRNVLLEPDRRQRHIGERRHVVGRDRGRQPLLAAARVRDARAHTHAPALELRHHRHGRLATHGVRSQTLEQRLLARNVADSQRAVEELAELVVQQIEEHLDGTLALALAVQIHATLEHHAAHAVLHRRPRPRLQRVLDHGRQLRHLARGTALDLTLVDLLAAPARELQMEGTRQQLAERRRAIDTEQRQLHRATQHLEQEHEAQLPIGAALLVGEHQVLPEELDAPLVGHRVELRPLVAKRRHRAAVRLEVLGAVRAQLHPWTAGHLHPSSFEYHAL